MNIRKGATRWVFCFRGYAVKIPSFYSWRHFLQGLIANMQERRFAGYNRLLCPVLFAVPGGFLLVMPKVEQPISIHDYEIALAIVDRYTLPVERKLDSFGYLNGEIVAVDYGS